MARSFRGSSFRGRSGAVGMGEDVNPQAYIVNLADCMLVLACGFMVALVSAYHLSINPYNEVDESQLQQVESEDFDEEAFEGGSSFIQAGTAYYDPDTGTYYIRETEDENGETVTSNATNTSNTSNTSSASNTSSSSSSASDADIRNAKAAGAD